MHSQSIASSSPIGGRGADQPHGGHPAGHAHAKADPGPAPGADLFRCTSGRLATLRLLRERVLARTRWLLDLPPGPLPARFAESAEITAPNFAGRLWAEQNQMAAPRLQTMSRGLCREAMAGAFQLGVQETLELLQEAGCLDAAGAELIAEVRSAFAAMMTEPGPFAVRTG